MTIKPKGPLLLLILDGWGERSAQDYNAIANACTPNWDKIKQSYPHTTLQASGLSVGLPEGQMGNSEVGHLNIGAGRCIYQSLTKINKAIEENTFSQNEVLLNAFDAAKRSGGCCHVLGLLSPGGIHSHEQHIFALIQLAVEQGITDLACHAFLDGRDTPPKSATESILALETCLAKAGVGELASITGRYYAMDRDQRWERIQQAYDGLTLGKSEYHYSDAAQALAAAYARGETDEFVQPSLLHPASAAPKVIKDNDVIIFMNFRADRARQLSYAFRQENFSAFTRIEKPVLADYVTLTEYAADIPAQVAYPKETPANTLADVLSAHQYKQLRIAETEKYAHVTFFFNGGVEAQVAGEDRKLIKSPDVPTYDCQPEMSVVPLTDALLEALSSGKYQVIIANIANPDMVGHTGNYEAAKQAIEAVDEQLGRILKVLNQEQGTWLITADHGNADCMQDPITHKPHTAHTCEQVPFIVIGQGDISLRSHGSLQDVAPTVLACLQLPVPVEMTGTSLISEE